MLLEATVARSKILESPAYLCDKKLLVKMIYFQARKSCVTITTEIQMRPISVTICCALYSPYEKLNKVRVKRLNCGFHLSLILLFKGIYFLQFAVCWDGVAGLVDIFWIDGDVTVSKTMFSEHFRYPYTPVYSAVQRIPLSSIEVTNNLLSGFRLVPSRIEMGSGYRKKRIINSEPYQNLIVGANDYCVFWLNIGIQSSFFKTPFPKYLQNLIQCAVIAFDPGVGTHRSLIDLSRPRLMAISSDDIKVISSTSSKRL
ncbi:unnamed protein product [Brugia pahangi]|uniref:Uncharacterized protein n=1 Tax=Brugia pahangi TaxID=6280 RepID=A0A0N4TLN0_BRUPA|nr:unnamed protein product [Brugia pahangi]